MEKKINIILGIVCVVLFIVGCYLIFLFNLNEKNKIYFYIDDLKNINWINKDDTFNIDNKKVHMVIKDRNIDINEKYDFNNRTGQLLDDMYIRSVSEDNIVIWYDQAEYKFNKEVILK